MLKFSLSFLLIVLSLFLMSESQAANTCSITAVGNVNFGTYNTLSSANADSTGSLTIDCTASWTTVSVSIGASPNSGGFAPRKMKLTTGTVLLDYNLYSNSARSVIWGDGTQGTSPFTPPQIQKNHPWTGTIYGRIPGSQDVIIGQYAEVLVITVNY